jgi:hypothetical protein
LLLEVREFDLGLPEERKELVCFLNRFELLLEDDVEESIGVYEMEILGRSSAQR